MFACNGRCVLTNGKSVNADEDLDKAISSVILGEYRPAHKKEYPAIYLGEGELPVEAHEILGKSIKNDKIEVYLMATYGSYEFQNDVFNMVNGSSQIPLRITFTTDEKQGHKLKDNKQQIYEEVWGEEYFYDDSNIMAIISRLRKKLEVNPSSPKYIQTVKGIGYRFNKEV